MDDPLFGLRKLIADAVEEGAWRGVLRALREVGLAGRGATLNPQGRLLTAEEAAARLKIPRKAVYELVRTGALRSVRIGRRLRFPESALMVWEQETHPDTENRP
jgi:excisionase family DNA binding protein